MSSANNPSLEESQKMKLEMREQIAVQNKMRALKRKEIEKYQPLDEEGDDQDIAISIPTQVPSSLLMAIEPYPYPVRTTAETEGGAIHTGGTPQQRPRAQSESLPFSYEDFWSVDMVDEQLFEFLMSTGDS
jgi:phosphopantothenoylcysteine synthetase/decarboxylase